MSKNDMLAPIVRALVGVPQERLSVLFDVINKVGGADGELWRTRFTEVLREGVLPSPKTSLDTLIRVDRSIRPVYPNWAKTAMYPEMELTGPTEYDLETINSWLHDIQKNGRSMEGHKLYKYLKKRRCSRIVSPSVMAKKSKGKAWLFFGSSSKQTFFSGNQSYMTAATASTSRVSTRATTRWR